MNFLSTSILSALSTVIKLASGLVINKVIAVYIGPAGIALIGQFQNFLNIVTTVGNGAINSGVTKYVAEYNEEDPNKRDLFISASFKIALAVSVILGLFIFICSSYLSNLLFQTDEYHILFKVLGSTLWLIALNTIILSIINGLKKIKLFITVNITGSILSLIFTTILTLRYGLWGALLALVLVQALLLFISLPIALKKIKIQFKWQNIIDNEYYKKLLSYALMTIVSVICISVTQIAIRNHLIEEFSAREAGYWQSVWMISTMYLMIMTTALSTYYLPRLSELKSNIEIRKEVISGYKIIIPFVLVTASFIYILREFIIILLFTEDFYPMKDLFLYQLIGDFLKMCSWSLSYLMIAKGMTRIFVVSEIIFAFFFYMLVLLFTYFMGINGVVFAYAINYLMYFLFVLVLFKDIWKNNKFDEVRG